MLITMISISILLLVIKSFLPLNILNNPDSRWFVRIFIFICTIILFNIRCLQYEYFTEFITIKVFQPWKKGLILPCFELPKDYLKSYNVKRSIIGYSLHLNIETNRGRCIIRKYNLFGFKTSQITKLKTSLDEFAKER